MLNKNLKMIILLIPVIMAGILISPSALSEEEYQMKPNIHQLTSEKTAEKVAQGKLPEVVKNSGPPADSNEKIPDEIHKHSLGLGIGQTFLRSDLATNGTDKITGDIYYNYSASHSFDFVANLHRSKHSFLNREATIKGLALSIKGKGYQFDAFSPYVLGGFGFYLPSVTRIQNNTPTETHQQLVFGINLGIGVELRLNSEVTVGVIAHYHDPFNVRQESGGDVSASYMKLLIIGLYTFN